MGRIGRLFLPSRTAPASTVAEHREAALAAHTSGDTRKPLSLWGPLAEAGEARALNAPGALYLEGDGVPRDLVAALIRLYRARQGRSDIAGAVIAQAEAARLAETPPGAAP